MANNNQIQARFVSGSTMQHIFVMTSTATLGLMAIFLVDLTDMYFLSLLGEQAIAAAIGFAGSIAFFTTSICIALSIAAGVKISREIGKGESDKARSSTTNIAVISVLVTLSVCAVMWPNIEYLLRLLGATGQTLVFATEYLQILLPSMPLLALGMVSAGVLRAVGDAKRAMLCTLAAGLANLVLDPLFIFQFGMGVKGAALASVCARVVLLWVGAYGVIKIHGLIARFRLADCWGDFRLIGAIAIPALFTNIATPVGAAFITRMISGYGDSYIAGYAVIGRVIPVAFAMIFALSGAIGSIIGQNYGAGLFDRVKQTQNNALLFGSIYTITACLLVWLSTTWISSIFNLQLEAAALFVFYWTFISWTYLFLGTQFIANASFNNLDRPVWSTFSNWGRVLFGTIPLAWLGAKFFGVYGVLIGEATGTILMGGIALFISRRLINQLHAGKISGEDYPGANRTAAITPLSSGVAATGVISCRDPSRRFHKQNQPTQTQKRG